MPISNEEYLDNKNKNIADLATFFNSIPTSSKDALVLNELIKTIFDEEKSKTGRAYASMSLYKSTIPLATFTAKILGSGYSSYNALKNRNAKKTDEPSGGLLSGYFRAFTTDFFSSFSHTFSVTAADGSFYEAILKSKENVINLINCLDETNIKYLFSNFSIVSDTMQNQLGLSEEDYKILIKDIDFIDLKHLLVEVIKSDNILKPSNDVESVIEAKASVVTALLEQTENERQKAVSKLISVNKEAKKKSNPSPESTRAYYTDLLNFITSKSSVEILSAATPEILIKILTNENITVRSFKDMDYLADETEQNSNSQITTDALTPKALENILMPSASNVQILITKALSSENLMRYFLMPQSQMNEETESFKALAMDELLPILKSKDFLEIIEKNDSNAFKIYIGSPIFAKGLQNFEEKTGINFQETFKDQANLIKNILIDILKLEPEKLKSVLTQGENYQEHLINILKNENGKEFLRQLPTEAIVKFVTTSPYFIEMFKNLEILPNNDKSPNNDNLSSGKLSEVFVGLSKPFTGVLLQTLNSPHILQQFNKKKTKGSPPTQNKEENKNFNEELVKIIKSEEFKKLINGSASNLIILSTSMPLIYNIIKEYTGLTQEDINITFENQPKILQELFNDFLKLKPEEISSVLNKEPGSKKHLLNIFTSESGRNFINSIPENLITKILLNDNKLSKLLEEKSGMKGEDLKNILNETPKATKTFLNFLLEEKVFLNKVVKLYDPTEEDKKQKQGNSIALDIIDILATDQGMDFLNSLNTEGFANLLNNSPEVISSIAKTFNIKNQSDISIITSMAPILKDIAIEFLSEFSNQSTNGKLSKDSLVNQINQDADAIAALINKRATILLPSENKNSEDKINQNKTSDIFLLGVTGKTIQNFTKTLNSNKAVIEFSKSFKDYKDSNKSIFDSIKFGLKCAMIIGPINAIKIYRNTSKTGRDRFNQIKNGEISAEAFLESANTTIRNHVGRNKNQTPEEIIAQNTKLEEFSLPSQTTLGQDDNSSSQGNSDTLSSSISFGSTISLSNSRNNSSSFDFLDDIIDAHSSSATSKSSDDKTDKSIKSHNKNSSTNSKKHSNTKDLLEYNGDSQHPLTSPVHSTTISKDKTQNKSGKQP